MIVGDLLEMLTDLPQDLPIVAFFSGRIADTELSAEVSVRGVMEVLGGPPFNEPPHTAILLGDCAPRGLFSCEELGLM